jgi:hypothetical protein
MTWRITKRQLETRVGWSGSTIGFFEGSQTYSHWTSVMNEKACRSSLEGWGHLLKISYLFDGSHCFYYLFFSTDCTGDGLLILGKTLISESFAGHQIVASSQLSTLFFPT